MADPPVSDPVNSYLCTRIEWQNLVRLSTYTTLLVVLNFASLPILQGNKLQNLDVAALSSAGPVRINTIRHVHRTISDGRRSDDGATDCEMYTAYLISKLALFVCKQGAL